MTKTKFLQTLGDFDRDLSNISDCYNDKSSKIRETDNQLLYVLKIKLQNFLSENYSSKKGEPDLLPDFERTLKSIGNKSPKKDITSLIDGLKGINAQVRYEPTSHIKHFKLEPEPIPASKNENESGRIRWLGGTVGQLGALMHGLMSKGLIGNDWASMAARHFVTKDGTLLDPDRIRSDYKKIGETSGKTIKTILDDIPSSPPVNTGVKAV